MITAFPPLENADEHGLLAVGGDLEVESLLLAYRSGIFPWPVHSEILAWFAPPQRAVIFTDRLKLSSSLRREIKRTPFKITLNTAFEQVISSCAKAKNRKGQRGTWITQEMIDGYCKLHDAGYAYSIEAWSSIDELAGGLYGVSIGRMFAAESMFYLAPNASKLCLAFLVDRLSGSGVSWLDVQVINPFTEALGAVEIARAEFAELLQTALLAAPIKLA